MSHWLDKYIVEQSADYGLTVEQKSNLFSGAAEYQELIDTHEVDEPQTQRDDEK